METNKNPIEVLEEALRKERDSVRERRLKLKQARAALLPVLTDLAALGGEFSFPGTVDYRISGDKHKFLALLRILNRHGFKTKKVEKGATEYYEWHSVEGTDLGLWVHFTSTVCRRVKVGKKMVEQDVYETVCDEIYPHGLDAAQPTEADSIPF